MSDGNMPAVQPRCDGCRFWKPDDKQDREATRYGFRECAAIEPRWVIEAEANSGIEPPYGPHIVWRTDPVTYEDVTDDPRYNAFLDREKAAVQAAKAYTQDASQYVADLFTAADFFCARFEGQSE